MASYPINKGVGRPVEVKGLRAQYVIYAVLGTVLSLLVVLFVSMAQALFWAFVLGGILLFAVWASCIYANRKYGEHGLQQHLATLRIPQRIAFVCSIQKLVEHEKNSHG